MNISIVDFSTRYNVGHANEDNVTTIDVTIPQELLDLNADHYMMHFLTSGFKSRSTGNLTAVEGIISTPLWDDIMDAGPLKMRIGAYDMDGLELVKRGYSDVVTLIVDPGIPDGIEGDTEAQGLVADLQTALLKVTKYIVDDLTALNALTGMSDGDQAIVRKITQKSDLSFDTITGDVCAPRFLPRLYFNPIILTPNWAELGVSSTALSCELSFARNEIDNIEPIHKYLLAYFPAELSGLEVVLLVDENESAKYGYSFAEDVDLGVVAGWNAVLTYDDNGDPLTYEAVTAPPAIKNAVSCIFDVSADGTASQKYFENILNTEPFTYRSYIRDGGEWILI